MLIKYSGAFQEVWGQSELYLIYMQASVTPGHIYCIFSFVMYWPITSERRFFLYLSSFFFCLRVIFLTEKFFDNFLLVFRSERFTRSFWLESCEAQTDDAHEIHKSSPSPILSVNSPDGGGGDDKDHAH